MAKKGISWIHVFNWNGWGACTVRQGEPSRHWKPTFESRKRLARLANSLPGHIIANEQGWHWMSRGIDTI